MDAPQPRDSRSELADLRRRAYGPDGDIHSDSAALARLRELEEQERGKDEAPTTSARVVSTSTAVLAPPQTVAAATTMATDLDDLAGPAAAPVPASPDRPASWRRRLRTAVLLGGAVLIGVGIGVTLPRLLPAAAPTATVGSIDQGDLTPDFLGARGLAYWGLEDDSLVPYEMFGESRVWAGVNSSGAHCIFIDVNGQWMDGGCTPLGLPPTAQYVNTESAAVPGDPPVRNVVRYVQRTDGLIEVWVAPAPDSNL